MILYDNLDGNENVVYNDDKLDGMNCYDEMVYDDRMLMLLISRNAKLRKDGCVCEALLVIKIPFQLNMFYFHNDQGLQQTI